ncbi:hypothetical protein R3P38DRAFT_3211895 [Favolaschia claudopus]|uniref:Uncharacterized protein n=1 Tax=Favolaschia claudopus TaxID=2862362 RepID=A0AAW0AE91_9AGAR
MLSGAHSPHSPPLKLELTLRSRLLKLFTVATAVRSRSRHAAPREYRSYVLRLVLQLAGCRLSSHSTNHAYDRSFLSAPYLDTSLPCRMPSARLHIPLNTSSSQCTRILIAVILPRIGQSNHLITISKQCSLGKRSLSFSPNTSISGFVWVARTHLATRVRHSSSSRVESMGYGGIGACHPLRKPRKRFVNPVLTSLAVPLLTYRSDASPPSPIAAAGSIVSVPASSADFKGIICILCTSSQRIQRLRRRTDIDVRISLTLYIRHRARATRTRFFTLPPRRFSVSCPSALSQRIHTVCRSPGIPPIGWLCDVAIRAVQAFARRLERESTTRYHVSEVAGQYQSAGYCTPDFSRSA